VDKNELPYLIMVIGAFGVFMIVMILLTLQEKAWIRNGRPRRR
jgi:hypothetical protein